MEGSELQVTNSYHTASYDSTDDEETVFIVNEDVPSHMKIMMAEVFSRRNKKIRTVKSNGAILILIVTCMINISFNGALGDILGKFMRDFLHIREAGIMTALGIVFVRSIPQLAYPVAGWIADVHFGRYRVILTSLWLMLTGYAIILITYIVKNYYNSNAGEYITYLAIFPIAFLAINIGLAAFQANIIPFGLDQMPDASTEELSAFIHWYYGSRNLVAGVIPLVACYVGVFNITTVVISASEVVLVTIALVLCYNFKRILIIEPKSVNPFKLLYKVLEFSLKNKVPVSRSAFTFWEDDIPSRIDLGKSKYGGPFTNEEVEDVKTFLRTTSVLIAICVFMISYYMLLLIGILFSRKMDNPPNGSHCPMGLLYQILLDTFPIFFMVVVFEIFIYPFFRACIPSMLKRIGIGMSVAILGLLILFTFDLYGYNHNLSTAGFLQNTSDVSSYCYLVNDSSVEVVTGISVHAISVLMLLGALAETLVFIAALEFITAQSPYGMRGMLVGAFYCIRGVYGSLSALLFLTFTLIFNSYPLSPTTGVSCGLPLNVVTIIIATIGLVVFIKLARSHKHRERDEQFDIRKYAEEYYYGHRKRHCYGTTKQ